MPSIRASARPNMQGWKQAESLSPGGEKSTPPPPQDTLSRSPFMTASMPLMASTGDAFARQFYTQNGLPQQRILPAKKASGA